MYRKYNDKSEMFSNVFVSFSLLLLCSVLLYKQTDAWVLQLNLTTYTYFAICAIVVIYFLYTVMIWLINIRQPKIDIEVNITEETIKIRNNRKTYSFKDISLYGRLTHKDETRILLKNKLYGILDKDLCDEEGNHISVEDAQKLGKYAKNVGHQHLYNFNLLVLIFAFGAEFVYAFIADNITGALRAVSQSTMFFILLGVVLMFTFAHYYHLYMLIREKKVKPAENDLETNEND